MTDPKRALTELPALLAERRQYESWLDALEAKRDTTPAHVFDRVVADYRARLQRVQEQLAAHKNALVEERTSLESRLSLVEAEEKMRRDEHAELDLRVHVGELAANDANAALRTLSDTLEQLASERQQLRGKLDALNQLGEIKAETRTQAPKTEEKKESFDELAFLSSIVQQTPPPGVGAPEGAQVETGDSLLSDLSQPRVIDPDAEKPLAANVPANTPIVLRASGAFEQSKSLKCSECGAMNYPTEWYCERCGAELAAL
jgi:hypothetical protein